MTRNTKLVHMVRSAFCATIICCHILLFVNRPGWIIMTTISAVLAVIPSSTELGSQRVTAGQTSMATSVAPAVLRGSFARLKFPLIIGRSSTLLQTIAGTHGSRGKRLTRALTRS